MDQHEAPEDPTPDCFNAGLLATFEEQATHLKKRARARREAVQLKSVILDTKDREQISVEDSLGKRLPGEEMQGCTNLRTLRTLMAMIDERGFERSPHQARRAPAPRAPRPRALVPLCSCPHPTRTKFCLFWCEQMKFHSAFERSTARVLYKE